MVSLTVVEMTAQEPSSEGCEVTSSINETRCLRDIESLSAPVRDLRFLVTTVHVDLQQQRCFGNYRYIQPCCHLINHINLNLLLVTGDPRRLSRRRVWLQFCTFMRSVLHRPRA